MIVTTIITTILDLSGKSYIGSILTTALFAIEQTVPGIVEWLSFIARQR